MASLLKSLQILLFVFASLSVVLCEDNGVIESEVTNVTVMTQEQNMSTSTSVDSQDTVTMTTRSPETTVTTTTTPSKRVCTLFNKPHCICALTFKPLCGSDGITYTNACQFNCWQRCKPGLTFVKCGPCWQKSSSGKSCIPQPTS